MAEPRQSDPDAFIRSLFEPLPADVEPVESKAFRRQVKKDVEAAWHTRWLLVESARMHMESLRLRGTHARMYGGLADGQGVPGEDEAFCAYVHAVHWLMLWPAPNAQSVQWKRAHRGLAGGRDAWEAAIAADKERLGLKAEARS